jgi:hypothetical protein
MEDVDGPRIAKSLYNGIFKGDFGYINPDDIAYALDSAVFRLRHEVKNPMRWVKHEYSRNYSFLCIDKPLNWSKS